MNRIESSATARSAPFRSLALAGTLAASVVATAGADWTNWEPRQNLQWHNLFNWSELRIPDAGTQVSLNPYFGPDPALIQILRSSGTAVCHELSARDWNCGFLGGCDYEVVIQGYGSGGLDAELHVDSTIRAWADYGSILGAGEANLTLAFLSVLAGELRVDEANDADATMRLVDVDARIRIGGDGVNVLVGTAMTLSDGTRILSESPGASYPFVVSPGAVLAIDAASGVVEAREADIDILGTLIVNGDFAVDRISALGNTLLNADLRIDGVGDSLLAGTIIGTGRLVKDGGGTLSVAGAPKAQTGGLLVRQGIVECTSEDQLGAGDVVLDGGGLAPVGGAMTIETRPIVLGSHGGVLHAGEHALTLDTTVTGSGTIHKRGDGVLWLRGAAAHTGGLVVHDGHAELRATAGFGTGTGPVEVRAGASIGGDGAIADRLTARAGALVDPGTGALDTLQTATLTLEAGSTCRVKIGQNDVSDRIAVAGEAVIESGATLDVLVPTGLVPADGARYLVIASPDVVGTFDSIDAPALDGAWSVEVTAEGVVLAFDATACAGDVDGDGVVGAMDLATVLGAWGACGDACDADLDGDGTVGASDLTIVLGAWGECD